MPLAAFMISCDLKITVIYADAAWQSSSGRELAAALLTVNSVKTFYEKKGLYLHLFLYHNLRQVRNLVSYL
jgi:hypothetical protein